MTEQKYTLEEAKNILQEKASREHVEIKTFMSRLKIYLSQGQLPYIDSQTMLYDIYANRKAIFEVLKDYQE